MVVAKPMSGTAKVSFTQLDLYTGARSQSAEGDSVYVEGVGGADAKAGRVSLTWLSRRKGQYYAHS